MTPFGVASLTARAGQPRAVLELQGCFGTQLWLAYNAPCSARVGPALGLALDLIAQLQLQLYFVKLEGQLACKLEGICHQALQHVHAKELAGTQLVSKCYVAFSILESY